MKQYTVAIDKQTGEQQLFADDNMCVCPFQTKMLVPGQLAGQLSVQQFGCTSGCMFFNYDDQEKKVITSCTKTAFNVTEKADTKLHLFNPDRGMA